MPHTMQQIMDTASVIPVLSVNELAHAAPLATALLDGGLRVIEMTLRSNIAIAAMLEMKATAPELRIGMGTILTPEQVEDCIKAKADFLVSPGLTPKLAQTMLASQLPCLPGVSSASEAMIAVDQGFEALKFFPAEQSGGLPWLKSIHGPLPHIRFCPTGSITAQKAPDYLAAPNVDCVGGSWVAPAKLVHAQNWAAITKLAQQAANMSG